MTLPFVVATVRLSAVIAFNVKSPDALTLNPPELMVDAPIVNFVPLVCITLAVVPIIATVLPETLTLPVASCENKVLLKKLPASTSPSLTAPLLLIALQVLPLRELLLTVPNPPYPAIPPT